MYSERYAKVKGYTETQRHKEIYKIKKARGLSRMLGKEDMSPWE